MLKVDCKIPISFNIFYAYLGPYVPGQPGGPWTDSEVEIVRQKILEMIDETNYVPKSGSNILQGKDRSPARRPTENKLLRLTFHDCIKYEVGIDSFL